MTSNFHMPPTGFGPGSQTSGEEGEELEFMPLPQEMRTYAPHVPEVEDPDRFAEALSLLADLADAADRVAVGGSPEEFTLEFLDPDNRRLVAETLGEGEVSIRMEGIPSIAAQESVFAGIWVLGGVGVDRVEVAAVPTLAKSRAFDVQSPALGPLAPKPDGVVNAPALLAELIDKSDSFKPGAELHVVNLTLLPHTEGDLLWLDSALGKGSVTILSRGYGNCRVQSTGQAHVWRVQFFNSMDTLILDTFEVGPVPEIAQAAPEDLADSAARLRDVRSAIA